MLDLVFRDQDVVDGAQVGGRRVVRVSGGAASMEMAWRCSEHGARHNEGCHSKSWSPYKPKDVERGMRSKGYWHSKESQEWDRNPCGHKANVAIVASFRRDFWQARRVAVLWRTLILTAC